MLDITGLQVNSILLFFILGFYCGLRRQLNACPFEINRALSLHDKLCFMLGIYDLDGLDLSTSLSSLEAMPCLERITNGNERYVSGENILDTNSPLFLCAVSEIRAQIVTSLCQHPSTGTGQSGQDWAMVTRLAH